MKAIQLLCASGIGKSASFLARTLKIGSGSVLSGHVAKKFCPDIFIRLSSQANLVIYVSGTNGKTTTTRLLASLFGNKRATYNSTGANLESGLISALVEESRWGKLLKDILLLEIDEKVLPSILEKRPPDILICLNLYRDQLDRHAETDLIKTLWQQALLKLPSSTTLILNGDDPTLVQLGTSLKKRIIYFGLSEPKRGISRCCHAVDSVYCPNCKTRLIYRTIYLSHLGDFYCSTCHFKRQTSLFDSSLWPSISPFLFNKYNTMSAVTAAALCSIDHKKIRHAIASFTPAFGRGEEIEIDQRIVLFLLSKNAVSLNESITIAKGVQNLGGILIALNDKAADGKDISWIWDADMEDVHSLTNNLVITGNRAYEMALCLHYNSASPSHVSQDFEKEVSFALKSCPKGSVLCMIATYTAMLALRKILTGKKLP